MNEFYVTGSEPWLPVAEEGVVAHAFAQGSAKAAVQIFQSFANKAHRFVRVRGTSDWGRWSQNGADEYDIFESQITGSDQKQLEITRSFFDQAILRVGPRNDWPDDDAVSTPKEATLTLYCSRKRWYDSFVDISLNRLYDAAKPKFVMFLRGDGLRTPIWQIQSKTGAGPYITHAEMDPVDEIWKFGPNTGISPKGGWMEKFYHNITTPAKGQIVRASTSADDAVSLSPIDSADPFGVVYDGVADSDGKLWIVTGGKAEVLYVNAVSRRQFARVCVAADTGAAAGSAIGEAMPAPPFATDKHFQEIGHVLQTIAAPGLALTALHFN